MFTGKISILFECFLFIYFTCIRHDKNPGPKLLITYLNKYNITDEKTLPEKRGNVLCHHKMPVRLYLPNKVLLLVRFQS